VKKNYQNDTTRARTGRATPKKTSNDTGIVAPSSRDGDDGLPEWALPESVTVAVADLAETAQEGLLALAVGTGSQVMAVIMSNRGHRRRKPSCTGSLLVLAPVAARHLGESRPSDLAESGHSNLDRVTACKVEVRFPPSRSPVRPGSLRAPLRRPSHRRL
jgi:hypothetical protein